MRRHLTYSNVISSICLFVVLGGSAYAATTITGKEIRDESLTGVDIRNGTLRSADFGRGALPAQPGLAPTRPALRAPAPTPRVAVPISLSLDAGSFNIQYVDVGAWTVGFSCSPREDRPQVQLWGQTDEGAAGTLRWVGIRSHSSEGSFITTSGTDIDPALRGLESRWAPEGGWADVGLDIQYRSGAKAGTVSVHMTADDRGSGPGTCTVAGTGIAAA